MLCKKRLQAERLPRAQSIARQIVHYEARGWGDRANAIDRLTSRHGLPAGLLWSLLYRPSKAALQNTWIGLLAAYEAECARLEDRARANREEARKLRDAASEGTDGVGGVVDRGTSRAVESRLRAF